MIVYGFVCFCFLAMCVGTLLVKGEPLWLWIGVIVGGGGTILFAIQCFSQATFLRVDNDSFTYAILFYKKTIHWHDVKRVFLYNVQTQMYVGWRLRSSGTKSIAPPDGTLPITYSMDPKALLALMSVAHYRSQGESVEDS
jgi:hypothetical protein